MHKLILILIMIGLFPIMGNEVFAQANKDNSLDVACAVSGGASTQLLAQRAGRYSYSINNTSGIDIRFAGVASGSPTLTAANSFLLKAGQPYSDSAPGLYTGRIVCQSTTAGLATITVKETYR